MAASALSIVVACSVAGCHDDEHWIDQALLADGRAINVERSVSYHLGNGGLAELTSWPNQYAFAVNDPDTGKRVHWSGEQNINPILLDFWKKVPYLVVLATSVFSDLKQYGCPEIPYVFFRYDEDRGRWTQIAPKDFPPQLLRVNLSIYYDGTFKEHGSRRTARDIENQLALYDSSSGNSANRTIPTDFASWPDKHKNEYRVSHYHDGCRHLVPSNKDPGHPQSPGQPSQKVDLAVLDTKRYDPEWVIKSDDQWSALAWDQNRQAKCDALLRRVGNDTDHPEMRGWLVFVNDPTGTKKARPSGDTFCNEEMIWFADYGLERHRAFLSAFTIQGDFIYRLSFEKPDEPGDYLGAIMQPTFRAENGYLYFEWWNTNQGGSDRMVKRSMKVRVREPLHVADRAQPSNASD